MGDEDELREALQALRGSMNSMSRNERWEVMHKLAAAGYSPAIAFFAAYLDSEVASTREFALECLGFHYDLSSDQILMEKFRMLLLHDADDYVRMAAASALGAQLRRAEGAIRSQDPSLVAAMVADRDQDVRYAAFSALLAQNGIPNSVINAVANRLKAGQMRPTVAELERLLSEPPLRSTTP